MKSLKFISTMVCLAIALPVTADTKEESVIDYAKIQARYDQCVATHRAKKYKEAISVCTDAINIAHDKLNISLLYGYRASSYYRLGDREKAKKDQNIGNEIGGKTREFVYMVLGDDV